jgi:hypothetical protein
MPTRNIELLKAVRHEVRRDAVRRTKRFNMNHWFAFPFDKKLAGHRAPRQQRMDVLPAPQ